MKNRILKTVSCVAVMLCVGCSSTIRESASSIVDPTERGLMYVATAIVIGAVLRAIFND